MNVIVKPKHGTYWRHTASGNVYRVIALAHIESTHEEVVVYRRDDEKLPGLGKTWVRPVREWGSRFTVAVRG